MQAALDYFEQAIAVDPTYALPYAGIADTFWGLGFVLLAAVYGFPNGGWPSRSGLVLVLVTVWGVRLALHIHGRNRGRPEDPRYASWRLAAGPSFWWKSLFTVFLLQALLLWIVSAPLLVAQVSPRPATATVFDVAGLAVWLLGFTFEAVGDAQLRAFKRDPANAGRVRPAMRISAMAIRFIVLMPLCCIEPGGSTVFAAVDTTPNVN